MPEHKIFPKGIEFVGGALIESPDGKILLTKSPKWNNKWTLPGGHINPGEKIEDATIREVKKETGVCLVLVDFIWVSPEEALKMDLTESFGQTIEQYIKIRR